MANSMLHVNLRPRRGVREAQLHDLHRRVKSLGPRQRRSGIREESSDLSSGRGDALPRPWYVLGGWVVCVRCGRRYAQGSGRRTAPRLQAPQTPPGRSPPAIEQRKFTPRKIHATRLRSVVLGAIFLWLHGMI